MHLAYEVLLMSGC